MFRGYIGNKSGEQSEIFVDYRLHYFCTVLYLISPFHLPFEKLVLFLLTQIIISPLYSTTPKKFTSALLMLELRMAHTQLALKTNAYYRITFDYIAKAFRLHYTEGKITTFQHAL